MKVVILAGGLGTRLSEETEVKPKPMVEIGDMPMLWHIMKIYSSQGFNDFIICLGYKGYVIKEYFANYILHKSDVTINLSSNKITMHDTKAEPWNITLIDTGLNTMTGGRIRRVKDYIGNETFLLTYGDGVADVNIPGSVDAHKKHGKLCTVTAVQPSGRFGAIIIGNDNSVKAFAEKPKGDGAWINGGFFVCEPRVIDYIKDDNSIWEREPMENICADGQMMVFKHEGFWKPMDTLRDKRELESDWLTGNAKWKTW
ncbi:MAG TPA: glucose-1-phosphate cytidylyltransferase [Chitinophagaceae bacterium]|jgi:glucose-1-phosphate cytidylyltransferase|nr:glucose-1-phosphate cytidylyltransferase [Chitinophagaceae bacterium]